MPNEQEQSQLLQDIEKLKKEVELLKNHQHLGQDGSKEFEGDTNFRGRTLTMAGGRRQGDRVAMPISIIDNSDQDVLNPQDKSSRFASMGIFINHKFTDGEEDNVVLNTGKNFPDEDNTTPLNRLHWSRGAEGRISTTILPNSTQSISGPSILGPLGFLHGERSPIVGGIGTISNGGSTITDSTADFVTNELIGSQILILDQTGDTLEGYRVYSNTTNTITMVRGDNSDIASFGQPSGSYYYAVSVPLNLGSAPYPWDRVYVGQDIRMGYGASSGDQVRFIKWGYGSPKDVISAYPGTLFIRFDGGSGTSLYIKSTGAGTATGWEKVTTTPA